MKDMKVKFNDSKKIICLSSCTLYKNKVYMTGEGITENLSGFILYEDDEETVVRDCSNYKYKWNIYTEYKNGLVLTNSEADREQEPIDNAEVLQEIIDPLTNEELTEAVASLMYEVSTMQLGMEV